MPIVTSDEQGIRCRHGLDVVYQIEWRAVRRFGYVTEDTDWEEYPEEGAFTRHFLSR